MTKFKVGKIYEGRSVCDRDCRIRVTVLSRTEKSVRAMTDKGEKTLRIKEYNNVEYVMPWGRYSMAPQVTAEKQVE